MRTLRTRPNVPAGELLAALGVSRATLMRAVHAAGSSILTIGRARRILYAVRRLLRGSAASLPVLAAFNCTWFGLAGRPWIDGGARLLERGFIDRDTSNAITRLWHFGQLIGNSDMHDGNLSFRPRVSASGPALDLAPVYDMLPMLYAPQRGVWAEAADDARISVEFRATCDQSLHIVGKTMGLLGGGPLPMASGLDQ